MTNVGEAKNEVQQRTKKSRHFQKINCGQANPKCSNAPKYLVIFKQQTVDKGNQSAAMQKKSSHFQMTNCEKRNRSAATHQKI